MDHLGNSSRRFSQEEPAVDDGEIWQCLSRHITLNEKMLQYRIIQSKFFSNTMYSTPKANSTRRNTCCQLFVSGKVFVTTYPLRSLEELDMVIHWFFKKIGVPVNLIVDTHWAQISMKLNWLCDKVGTILNILEKVTPWANRDEMCIGLLKESVRKHMCDSNSPMVIWYYMIDFCSLIQNIIPFPLSHNHGINTHELTLGAPEYISNLRVYVWYEWTYYLYHGTFPEKRDKLGRILGTTKMKGIKWLRPYLQRKCIVVTIWTCSAFESLSWFVSLRKMNVIYLMILLRGNLVDICLIHKIPPLKLYPLWIIFWGSSTRIYIVFLYSWVWWYCGIWKAYYL